MFINSSPLVRYPIAILILAGGLYLQRLIPNLESFYTVLYVLLAGVFAWEVALGFLMFICIMLAFKLVGQLPIGVTLVLLFLAAMFFGL